MERIGFIGLGNMGGGLAGSLARSGADITVFDIDPAKVAKLVALGAKAGTDVASTVRAAEVVFTVLPASAHVREVILGPAGVRDSVAKGTLVVEMSTIDPATTDELRETLIGAGIGFIDSPLGRGPEQAATGKAMFMVGATDNDLGRVRPLFDTMGDTVIHCGGPGTGIRTKIVNNFIGMAVYQVDAEALALATKLGLDIDRTVRVITNSLATNGALAQYWPTKVLIGDTEPGFAIDLALKDIGLAVDTARANGVPMVVGGAARECYTIAAKSLGLGQRDVSAMLEAQCRLAGVETPRLKSANPNG
jgi:4-hydroxybutyrate dehydrogenase/sulfolactaldehyde 3-reductase